MATKNFTKVAGVVLTLVLVFALFSVSVFATGTVADEIVTADLLMGAADTTDAAVDSNTGETEVADSETAVGTDTAADTATETGVAVEDKTEEKGISTGTIVGIVIVALIVVFAAIYCIKNKDKVVKFIRELKSELKKIVWTPWSQVKKNTFVVIVVVVACAAAGAVFDFLFSKGIISLGNLF